MLSSGVQFRAKFYWCDEVHAQSSLARLRIYMQIASTRFEAQIALKGLKLGNINIKAIQVTAAGNSWEWSSVNLLLQ